MGNKEDQHTFAVNKCQPVCRYIVAAQSVHGSDIRQWWHFVVFSWWECLSAYLVLVVYIQEARDNRRCVIRRRGLHQIISNLCQEDGVNARRTVRYPHW